MSKPIPLLPGRYYHVFNRGNNRELLFREQRNYTYFLRLYALHIEPVAETYAYSLLPNHFHFMIRVRHPEFQTGPFLEKGPVSLATKKEPVSDTPASASRQFNNLFIAYAKAVNKAYQRTGALFERPFKRKLVGNRRYLQHLLTYINQNPVKHGFVADPADWPWSSYSAICTTADTRIQRATVLEWFGGLPAFVDAHQAAVDESRLAAVMIEDWD